MQLTRLIISTFSPECQCIAWSLRYFRLINLIMILENYHYFSALILSKNSLPNIQAKIRYILHFLQRIFHFKVALI